MVFPQWELNKEEENIRSRCRKNGFSKNNKRNTPPSNLCACVRKTCVLPMFVYASVFICVFVRVNVVCICKCECLFCLCASLSVCVIAYFLSVCFFENIQLCSGKSLDRCLRPYTPVTVDLILIYAQRLWFVQIDRFLIRPLLGTLHILPFYSHSTNIDAQLAQTHKEFEFEICFAKNYRKPHFYRFCFHVLVVFFSKLGCGFESHLEQKNFSVQKNNQWWLWSTAYCLLIRLICMYIYNV